MMAVDWVGYGYAALVASGGVMGYVKAGSVPSLAAGLLFGSLAGFGAYQVSQNPQNIWVSLVATANHLIGTFDLAEVFMSDALPVTTLFSKGQKHADDFAATLYETTSGTLAALMGSRFYKSRKIMPAGIVAGASVLMLAKLSVGLLQKPQDS